MISATFSSIASVSDSTKYDPPRGSTVRTTPVSWARICCVRSARVVLSSVGSANGSSHAAVNIDCTPPSTAAIAWYATRTMLLCGCWAWSVHPPHTTPVRNIDELAFCAP